MVEKITKSPCHNSGITQEGECDVCRRPVEGGVPTEAPEPTIGNPDDAMGKTTGPAAPAPVPPEQTQTENTAAPAAGESTGPGPEASVQ